MFASINVHEYSDATHMENVQAPPFIYQPHDLRNLRLTEFIHKDSCLQNRLIAKYFSFPLKITQMDDSAPPPPPFAFLHALTSDLKSAMSAR